MESLKLLPVLAVLLFVFLAPPVNGYYDPEKIETPIIQEGDDHPWGGEDDPSGGGDIDKLNQSDGDSFDFYFINVIWILWVPDYHNDRNYDAEVKNRPTLPGSFIFNRSNTNNGSEVR